MKRIVFCCCTTYHLVSSLYYVTKIRWDKDVQTVLVWSNNSPYDIEIKKYSKYFHKTYEIQSQYKIQEKGLGKQIQKIKRYGWGFAYTDLGKYCNEESERTCIVAFAFDVLTSQVITQVKSHEQNSIIVLAEEGIAIYSINLPTIMPKKNRFGNLICGLKTEKDIVNKDYIDCIIAKKPEALPSSLLENKRSIKQSCFYMDHKWMDYFLLKVENLKFLNNWKRNCVIWIGQPLEKMGDKPENLVLKEIFDYLTIRMNLTVIIKPHPRDYIDKYKMLTSDNVEVIDDNLAWMPVELLIGNIQPKVAITPFSSACQSISEMHINCKVVYCYKLFGINMKKDLRESKLLDYPNAYEIDNIEELDIIMNMKIEDHTYCDNASSVRNDIDYLSEIMHGD